MDDFIPALAMVLFVGKLVDFFKMLLNGDKRGAGSQVFAWAAGVISVLLFAQTDWAGAIPVGDSMLGDLNLWSQVVAGLTMASVASTVIDFKQAVDNTDSAAKPPLFGGSSWSLTNKRRKSGTSGSPADRVR